MKQYIRLKDNRIIDTKKLKKIVGMRVTITFEPYKENIVSQSDDIADLITFGDLVVIKENGNLYVVFNKQDIEWLVEENTPIKLYTKQGDNYILVWDIERGVV